MNDVALCANDVLRNDVMLRINEVALRANEIRPFARFFNSKVFRNFVDAFPRRALLAHLFGSVDRFEPAKRLKCLQNCDIIKPGKAVA